jgi:hypothetical protein
VRVNIDRFGSQANAETNGPSLFFLQSDERILVMSPFSWRGRLFRDGIAVISAERTGINERLGSSAERWQGRLEKLKGGRLPGRFLRRQTAWIAPVGRTDRAASDKLNSLTGRGKN